MLKNNYTSKRRRIFAAIIASLMLAVTPSVAAEEAKAEITQQNEAYINITARVPLRGDLKQSIASVVENDEYTATVNRVEMLYEYTYQMTVKFFRTDKQPIENADEIVKQIKINGESVESYRVYENEIYLIYNYDALEANGEQLVKMTFETEADEQGNLAVTAISGDKFPETIEFPSQIGGVAVKNIAGKLQNAGSRKQLSLHDAKKVVIPENVNVTAAFFGTGKLETAVLPETLEALPNCAFKSAASLKNINLENVKTIGNEAFAHCTSLVSVNLSSAESIAENAFDGVKELVIFGVPGSVAEEFAVLHGYTFMDASEENTEIIFTTYFEENANSPDTLYITGIVCNGTPETVVFPSHINGYPVSCISGLRVYENGDMAFVPFDLKGAKHVVIPEKININSYFIGTQNLETVRLPSTLEQTYGYAFATAENLTSINLENVKRVSSYSFMNCKSLTAVNLSSAERIVDNAFDGIDNLIIYGVPGSEAERFANEKGYTFVEVANTKKEEKTVRAEADKLYKLGLFKGVGVDKNGDPDYAFTERATRTEAVVMLVRMLGKEVEALNYAKTHPFTDVPEWADGYISYAYENGLVNGVSPTLFNADAEVTHEMFLTFMLRSLGYSDSGENPDFNWEKPWIPAVENKITERAGSYGQSFERFEMADMVYQTLFAKLKNSDSRLFEKLIDDGVFTIAEWNEA